ncbi:MAG: substrate-binding domain-containing protein [Verrucomicrobiae bacterium]|nr:substrate-binding domain-containing protein [Verrucomicrobiae bacterium]NNJ86588.1 substrate-binding domain-containing protein [Akkermansiaceae bacterium]
MTVIWPSSDALSPVEFKTIAAQVAEHLAGEILRGRWVGTMPGKHQLADELGVNNKTVEVALKQLEQDGVIVSRGPGRRRMINPPSTKQSATTLRVAIMILDEIDRDDNTIKALRHLLEENGHIAFYTEKTLADFGDRISRLSRYVKSTSADAWIIVSGPRDVLEWFSAQSVPAFALFGRRHNLPIAGGGPDKLPAYLEATRRLLDLGHQRISLLCRRQLRLPKPGRLEQGFLDELENAGIPTSNFHLPDWEESKEGYGKILQSLFDTTPPTALIVDEPFLFNATYHFLSKRRLQIPEDVSLVCTDYEPSFAWCQPAVTHIYFDYKPVVRRVMQWIGNIGRHQSDTRQTMTKAVFCEGETIGPVRKE